MFDPKLNAKQIARFWSRADKSACCWLWTLRKDARGYGRASVHSRPRQAHRVAYALANGPFDAALMVCHHCDNPGCVRPEHLFLGTASDNFRDMVAKGRYAGGWTRRVGEAHPRSRLTEAAVREIRHAIAAGRPRTELAQLFNVQIKAISDVIRGRTWSHVQSAPPKLGRLEP